MSPNPPHTSDPRYVGVGLDYLGATVPADVSELLAALVNRLGGEPRTTFSPKGYGYTSAVGVFKGDDPIAVVLHDISRDPFVIARGFDSMAVWNALAEEWPFGCTASRKDAAVDLGDADWFEPVTNLAVEIANRRKLDIDMRGDWLVPGSPKGRTLYVGSRTSVNYLRIYEFKKHHGHGPAVRIELEHKPKRPDAKEWCFGASPHQLLGRFPLCVELLDRIGVDVSRTVPRLYSKPPSDLERAVTALVQQYGKLVRERLLPLLDNDATRLGPYLLGALDDLEKHRRSVRHAAAASHATTSLDSATVGE